MTKWFPSFFQNLKSSFYSALTDWMYDYIFILLVFISLFVFVLLIKYLVFFFHKRFSYFWFELSKVPLLETFCTALFSIVFLLVGTSSLSVFYSQEFYLLDLGGFTPSYEIRIVGERRGSRFLEAIPVALGEERRGSRFLEAIPIFLGEDEEFINMFCLKFHLEFKFLAAPPYNLVCAGNENLWGNRIALLLKYKILDRMGYNLSPFIGRGHFIGALSMPEGIDFKNECNERFFQYKFKTTPRFWNRLNRQIERIPYNTTVCEYGCCSEGWPVSPPESCITDRLFLKIKKAALVHVVEEMKTEWDPTYKLLERYFDPFNPR